jgi:hypothetical protein
VDYLSAAKGSESGLARRAVWEIPDSFAERGFRSSCPKSPFPAIVVYDPNKEGAVCWHGEAFRIGVRPERKDHNGEASCGMSVSEH